VSALPVVAVFLAVLLAQPLHATKPCSSDTWFGNKDRTAAEWAKSAAWVAVGKVSARKEVLEPYPNCQLADRSQCAMQDKSIVTLKVTRWEKGAVSGAKTLKLGAGWCAPSPPAKAGGTFRFYGREPGSYLYFEKLPK
jgi:hypothetical protein